MWVISPGGGWMKPLGVSTPYSSMISMALVVEIYRPFLLLVRILKAAISCS
jgi:hypothetical protein